MEALVISPTGAPLYERVSLSDPNPGPGQVLLRMQAVGLNYRDWLIRSQPVSAYAGDMRGRVPLSDGVGIVTAMGDGVTRFAVGDRVCPTFFPGWMNGPPTERALASALGAAQAGGTASALMVVDEQAAVRAPDHLDDAEAASLSCAGLTAWVCLAEYGHATAGQSVLLQGTGAVSLFGLIFARALGLRTILISSDDAKLERARALGAEVTLNYRNTPDWADAVLEMTGGVGADHVIDVGGEATLPLSAKAAAWGGHVYMVGILTGLTPTLPLDLVNRKLLHAHGIYVGSRASFERMNTFISQHGLRPVIGRRYGIGEANAAIEELAAGRHFGKTALLL